MGRKQIEWLQRVLKCAESKKNDIVFVFGHHALSQIVGESGQEKTELEETLASNRHVVAYFYGHDHEHAVCGDKRKTVCRNFWEIQTAGMLEYPQEARMVRVKYAGEGLAYLDVFTFAERLDGKCEDEFCKSVKRGREAAERDLCDLREREGKKDACTFDKHVYRRDGQDTNARLFFLLPEYRPPVRALNTKK